MVYGNELLIAIDPGHGGWDNGASFQGRLEKDDNLRLGLEVQRQLLAQGINVLMTRDTDVYVPLADRAAMANQADADLFVSLHRNSYIEQTPMTNGVENFIYLTAPMETSGMAAQFVLDRVADVGVQSNRGVQRGNYYVLRRTIMPAMLLEMGFIIDEIDNQLFDDNFYEYAAAIAKGIMQFFELPFKEIPGVTPPPPEAELPIYPECPPCPPCPELPPEYPETPAPPVHPVPPVYPVPPECPVCPPCPTVLARDAQRATNERLGLAMPLTGLFDQRTHTEMVKALQIALNRDFNAHLDVNGELNPRTLAAFPNVFPWQRGNVVFVIQALLALNDYNPGKLDGIFGPMTKTAVQTFQRDHYITPDGVVRQPMIRALFGAAA